MLRTETGEERRRQWWAVFGQPPELWVFIERIARLDSARGGYWVWDDPHWVYRILWVTLCKAGPTVCPIDVWEKARLLIHRRDRRWSPADREAVLAAERRFRAQAHHLVGTSQ